MKHKEKIIAALEKHKQGTGRLHTIQGEQGKFCIAGIFCEVHRQIKKGKWELKATLHNKDKIMQYLGESHFLPEEVQKYFEITREIGRVTKDKVPRLQVNHSDIDLVSLNDMGMTFPEFSKLIKDHF